jgi:hypothetical protein
LAEPQRALGWQVDEKFAVMSIDSPPRVAYHVGGAAVLLRLPQRTWHMSGHKTVNMDVDNYYGYNRDNHHDNGIDDSANNMLVVIGDDKD